MTVMAGSFQSKRFDMLRDSAHARLVIERSACDTRRRAWGGIAFFTALILTERALALDACARSDGSSAPLAQPPKPLVERDLAETRGPPDAGADTGFRHDGFFARAEVSLALLSAHIEPSRSSTQRTSIRAWGQSSQFLLGGTPMPGLVVGGLLGAARLDPAFVEGGQRIVPDDDSIKVSLVRVGPFVDWYPNPRRGFHTQIALALAVLVESDLKGNPIEPAAIGPSASAGLGQEWFLARSWSLGLFSRLSFGRLSRSVDQSHERILWESFDIGVTSTYH